jgi:UvrD-like helicase C-terminal domain
VEAKGRSRRLSRNYRNTKQILEFAWQAAQSVIQDVEETETQVRVLPTKASRQGPVPVYRGCASMAEEHALIARLVVEFRAKGLAGRDIAVLYPRREGNRVDALCRRLRESGEVCWVSNEADPGGGIRSLARPGVRLMTIHASKGLEFPAVIVWAVDQLPSPMGPDEVRDGNLLYVGLTRAIDHLAVTWTGRSAFTDRIDPPGVEGRGPARLTDPTARSVARELDAPLGSSRRPGRRGRPGGLRRTAGGSALRVRDRVRPYGRGGRGRAFARFAGSGHRCSLQDVMTPETEKARHRLGACRAGSWVFCLSNDHESKLSIC